VRQLAGTFERSIIGESGSELATSRTPNAGRDRSGAWPFERTRAPTPYRGIHWI